MHPIRERPSMSVAATPRTHVPGPLRFVRYAFMPNHLGFCGSDHDTTILEYATEGVVDGGLRPLIESFAGAAPYLRLIATVNGIADPFDARVVEAYWLGNDLLEHVEVAQLHEALRGDLGKRLGGKAKAWIDRVAPAGARPHHNFHVFDVYRRIRDSETTMRSMDMCRISWGRVLSEEGAELLVERRPLAVQEGRLALGAPEPVLATRKFEGRGFADDARPGDWVSLHWNWVCEVISESELQRLARYTHHHMRIASETI